MLWKSVILQGTYYTTKFLQNSSLRSSFSTILSPTMSTFQHDFVMDDFCIRQFNNPNYTGTQVNYDIQEFEKKVNEYFRSGEYPLVDGYAPFW